MEGKWVGERWVKGGVGKEVGEKEVGGRKVGGRKVVGREVGRK